MDIVTLSAAKAYANKVAAGFSSVSVDGSTINFTLNDGTETSLTVPTPADGVSVTGLTINAEGHLITTFSNGDVVDSGAVGIHIPQRGVDYWTEDDIETIDSYIDNKLSGTTAVDTDDANYTLIFYKI